MLLQHDFLGLYWEMQKLVSPGSGCLYHPPDNNGLMRIKKSCKKGLLVRSGIVGIITFSTFVGIFAPPQSGNGTVEKSMLINITSIFVTALLGFYERGFNPESMLDCLNGLVTWERRFANAKFTAPISRKEKLVRIVCNVTKYLASVFVVVAIPVGCIMQPSIKLNMLERTNLFGSECAECGILEKILRSAVIFTVNFIAYTLTISMGTRVFVDGVVGVTCIETCQRIWFRRVHLLLNKQITKNGFPEAVAYRSLQIIVTSFNSAMKHLFFSLCFSITITHVTGIYAIIREGPKGNLPIPVLVYFGACSTQSFIANLALYGMSGDVYENSKTSMENLMRCKIVYKNKNVNKFFKSCSPIRIEFGSTNFVEKTTPIVIEMFNWQRITELLLMSKSTAR